MKVDRRQNVRLVVSLWRFVVSNSTYITWRITFSCIHEVDDYMNCYLISFNHDLPLSTGKTINATGINFVLNRANDRLHKNGNGIKY